MKAFEIKLVEVTNIDVLSLANNHAKEGRLETKNVSNTKAI